MNVRSGLQIPLSRRSGNGQCRPVGLRLPRTALGREPTVKLAHCQLPREDDFAGLVLDVTRQDETVQFGDRPREARSGTLFALTAAASRRTGFLRAPATSSSTGMITSMQSCSVAWVTVPGWRCTWNGVFAVMPPPCANRRTKCPAQDVPIPIGSDTAEVRGRTIEVVTNTVRPDRSPLIDPP